MSLTMSEYSKGELENFGFKNINVLPVFIDFDKYGRHINENLLIKKMVTSGKNLIFVGRTVPNKKQEDIIKTFYFYKKINPFSKLFLIGETKSCPRYVAFLKDLITKLKLPDVHITGDVSFDELIGFYRSSDIFICMSEHEGFCVPLLEAMYFKLPVIAYNSTAIPYTLGDAGVLINEKNYSGIAELIDTILIDNKLHSQIITKQNERWQEFTIEKTSSKLKKYIEM